MTRADIVRAMDLMVYTINDENIIDSWLMVGVADGDIRKETTSRQDNGFTISITSSKAGKSTTYLYANNNDIP